MLASLDAATSRANRMSPEEKSAALQKEREDRDAARRRMRDMMGGDSEKLRRGAGAAFGFGGMDREDYGLGNGHELPMEMDLLTGKPLEVTSLKGDGFDGRKKDWRRKPELGLVGPPPMENSLRAPGQVSPPAFPGESDPPVQAADALEQELEHEGEALLKAWKAHKKNRSTTAGEDGA